jgi:hypothetical protein
VLERLEYFWGLFDRPNKAKASAAKVHCAYNLPDIPQEVEAAFVRENIGAFEGDYGTADVGHPTEVDSLIFTVDGVDRTVRVLNRSICMFSSQDDELTRLHRFFSVLLLREKKS